MMKLEVALVGLAAACTQGSEPGVSFQDQEPLLTLLTDAPGPERNPRVSPDGRTLAFDAPGEAGSRVFLLDLESGDTSPLTSGPGNDRRPAWSPDGRRIAFISDRGGSQGVWVQPLDDSVAHRELDAGSGILSALDMATGELNERTTGGDEWWPAWTADGEWEMDPRRSGVGVRGTTA